MKFRLVVEKGAQRGAAFPVRDGETVIGRSHSAGLRLEDADVSSKHVLIVCDAAGVSVENLSRFGARLDDRPLTAKTRMAPGQRLSLGAGVTLVLQEAAAGDAADATYRPPEPQAAATSGGTLETGHASAHESPTGGTRAVADDEDTDPGDDAQRTRAVSPAAAAAASRTAAPPSAAPSARRGEAAMDSVADAPEDAEAASVDGTRELHTRPAADDELEALRKHIRRRAGVRFALLFLGILIFLGACAWFWYRKKQDAVEELISWPSDRSGEFLEASKPSRAGGFEVVYPQSDADVKDVGDAGIMVACRLGKKRDVPLHIFVDEQTDNRLVSEDREQTVKRWMESVAGEGGKWTFDRPLPVPVFLGDDNGVPCIVVTYRRVERDAWFGTARIVRSGKRLIVVRAEVPARDRLRTEGILFDPFLRFSDAFVLEHWEGAGTLPGAPAAELVAEARRELRRDAPATWCAVQGLLFAALRKAGVENQEAAATEARGLLVELRNKQRLWFNEQYFARNDALSGGDNLKADRVAELCRAVFSDAQDHRFYEARQWSAAIGD